MKTKQQTKMMQQTYRMNQTDAKTICAMIKLDSCKKVTIYSEILKGDDMSTNNSKAPQWFVNFADKQETFNSEQRTFNSEQRTFNSEVRQFMVKQEVFNQDIKQDVQHLKQDVQHLKQDVQLILSLPTVKQEINALNK